MRNIIRAFFLAFLATTAGCLFSFTLPDGVASLLGKTLPAWVYANQVCVGWVEIFAIKHALCCCGGSSTHLKLIPGPDKRRSNFWHSALAAQYSQSVFSLSTTHCRASCSLLGLPCATFCRLPYTGKGLSNCNVETVTPSSERKGAHKSSRQWSQGGLARSSSVLRLVLDARLAAPAPRPATPPRVRSWNRDSQSLSRSWSEVRSAAAGEAPLS